MKKKSNPYDLIGKIFVSFYIISFVTIFVISLIYYFNFKFLLKEQKLITPIIINASTKELTKSHRELFKKINPFGFIFYSNSIESFKQIQDLNKDLKSLFPNRKLYIAIDQEGGKVDRLRKIAKRRNLTLLKSASYYGEIAASDLKKAKSEIYQDSKTTAKLLKDLGFNMNLAPMLDLSANKGNSRICSDDPNIAYELGLSFIQGMKNYGIETVIKHLPGIGNSKKDTHDEKVFINLSKADLIKKDLIPFKKLAKISSFGMVTHAIFTQIDREPATISKKTIDFIKKETDFKGFLISDAFNMKAVSSLNSYSENSAKAFESGIDIIIPNCSDHYCDLSILKAAEKLGHIKKFNKKLQKFEKKHSSK